MSVSAAASMPIQRGLVVLVALALVLASIVPLAVPSRVDAVSDDLFISEYIEGSGFNKAIEIYNGTGATVDLAAEDYFLKLYTNGSTMSQSVELTGTVADGDVYVVSRTDATSEVVAQTDQFAPGVINFNGDDAVVLAHGDVVVDVFGRIGEDPGDFWGVEPTTTLNHTLVRTPTVTDGDTDGLDAFDPAIEWTAYASNTTSFLGSHTMSNEPVATDPSGTGAASPTIVETGGQALLTVAVTPGTDPASTGLSVSADLTPIGGSTSQAFRDDGTQGDATANDGTYSYLATVGDVESGDKVITATISDAEQRAGTTQITLTVTGAPTEIWEIQGAAHLSEYDGEQVFDVEGVVTATRNSSSAGGFWMTDPTPDGDPDTADGIFVFRPGIQTVTVGQLVEVSGTVDEFRPGRRLREPHHDADRLADGRGPAGRPVRRSDDGDRRGSPGASARDR